MSISTIPGHRIGVAEFALVASDLISGAEHNAAHAVVTEGLRQYPGAAELLGLRTRVFTTDDDRAAEAEYLSAVCKAAPYDADAHLRLGIVLLRDLARLDEADAILTPATARFPANIALAGEYAWLAAQQNNLPEVVRRYGQLHRIDPDNAPWLAALCGGLRDLGRYDDADALLVPALTQFGANATILTSYAWVGYYRAWSDRDSDHPDWPEALQRWQMMLAADQEDATATWMTGRILSQHLRQHDAAARILLAGTARHPDHIGIAVEYARAPAWAGNWPESLRRLRILELLRPDDLEIRVFCGEAELQAEISAADAAAGVMRLLSAPQPQATDLALADPPPTARSGAEFRDLLLGFESMGHNCEFGFVQRHFGAEPLGLLRWNSISPENLALGLEQHFERIGEAENVRLSGPGGEYIVHELRFNMTMHTFLWDTQTTVPHEQLRQQFIRRMKFLARKLHDDLIEGSKIFVYQYPLMLTDAQMTAIEAGVRVHGPGRVLFVNDLMTDRPAGHVEQTSGGRLIGYVDRLNRSGLWADVSFDAWLKICQQARKFVQDGIG